MRVSMKVNIFKLYLVNPTLILENDKKVNNNPTLFKKLDSQLKLRTYVSSIAVLNNLTYTYTCSGKGWNIYFSTVPH